MGLVRRSIIQKLNPVRQKTTYPPFQMTRLQKPNTLESRGQPPQIASLSRFYFWHLP